MAAEDYEKVRLTILRKLYSKKAWGKGHLLFERLQSGMPPHLYGLVKIVLKDLLREGLVSYYGRTVHGDAYHLNMEKKDEIDRALFGDIERSGRTYTPEL